MHLFNIHSLCSTHAIRRSNKHVFCILLHVILTLASKNAEKKGTIPTLMALSYRISRTVICSSIITSVWCRHKGLSRTQRARRLMTDCSITQMKWCTMYIQLWHQMTYFAVYSSWLCLKHERTAESGSEILCWIPKGLSCSMLLWLDFHLKV